MRGDARDAGVPAPGAEDAPAPESSVAAEPARSAEAAPARDGDAQKWDKGYGRECPSGRECPAGEGRVRRLGCIAFTRAGLALAERIREELGAEAGDGECWEAGVACGFGEGRVRLGAWTSEHFAADDALLFVGATGIAVRAVAPHVQAKTSDPAVLVMDESGTWVISLLSGHIGGANRLAQRVAAAVGATPVVTTATDRRGLWAVDAWAARVGLAIANPHAIKAVSSKLLAGGVVRVFADAGVELAGTPPERVALTADVCTADVVVSPWAYAAAPAGALRLVPRCVAVGVGCRRGIGAEALERGWEGVVREEGRTLDERAVASVGSIDLKAHEPGLLAFCARHGWTLETYPAERLRAVEGHFMASAFVASVTGVDNVCERAALVGGGALAVPKRAAHGTTFALAVRPAAYVLADV